MPDSNEQEWAAEAERILSITIRELEETLQRFERAGGKVLRRPTEDPSLLKTVQSVLGLQFPNPVQAFYRLYECLQVGSYEFVWIRLLPDLAAKIRVRRPEIPRHYLPALADGMGGYYFVVCAEEKSPLPLDFGSVVYNPGGHPTILETCNSDFLDFVATQVEKQFQDLHPV